MWSIFNRLLGLFFASDARVLPLELHAPERIELVMADDSGEVVKEQSEVVAAANLKVVGDVPAFYTGIAMGNAVAHQQSMQNIQTAATGKIAEMLIHTSPSEAGADLSALQALIKLAQTVPPVSAPPPVATPS